MSGAQDTTSTSIPRPEPTAALNELGRGEDAAAFEESEAGQDGGDEDAFERPLDQSEIDNLLGSVLMSDEDKGPVSGLERIIGAGLVAYERLPMLEVVFDRLMRIVSTSLRSFTNDNVEVSLDGISSLRFGDYLNSARTSSIFAVFKAEEWENYGLMVIDSSLTYSMVDVLLGGARNPRPLNVEGRAHTTIERALVEKMVRIVLADLSAGFDPICAVNFKFERLEVSARFATICRTSNAVFMARMRVEMDDRGGNIDVILPYATLEPVRELLVQQFMGEKFGRDPVWETNLIDHLQDTDIVLDAVLSEQTMKFSEVSDLKPGSVLMLEQEVGASIDLRCGSVSLFMGKSGRKKEQMAVRIEEDLLVARTMFQSPDGVYS
ncbi:flagellar motor switch protein FliM [Acetobacter sp.]|jgi:flagellar motor switch protein FliM|uniref:flagellar motor switch protein FliM n=1 Tax=Acetobacter sp. TaxID=440 RepID=UPI0025C41489|nr:flagellar motor switch protein FliM [Acetobacter sp.]MCH4092188.1 flagellar motor switch protein FliM [Acetobacter sp.]MCI1299895.1 flagellar motor switch protein FliM [Acetobacter sp.]MCI1315913.1 flagellar motor switch protein FliM [Acetobacter sp.]